MKNIFKSVICFSISFILTINSILVLNAEQSKEPYVAAEAAILIDKTTGKVLFAKNEHKRMYPASTTKILTALVALDYLSPDEMITMGNEITTIPGDSSMARHKVGETIRVDNLLRGLIIPSGNDSGCALAMAVAKKVSENDNISYPEAERLFCDLMNEKAKALGALDSHFTNPHGYHNDEHYSTAYDLALIASATMNNELIKQIVKEPEFNGNGAGENPAPSLMTQVYTSSKWKTHNELLVPNGEYYYPYATGLKTGFNDEAGNCLIGSAEKDGKEYISVALFCPDNTRWTDSIAMFDYGFETFNTEVIQESGDVLDNVKISNPRLGDPGFVSTYTTGSFSAFLSKDEFARIVKRINYNEELIAPEEPVEGEAVVPSGEIFLKTPIEKDQPIGKISYYLDDELLYSSDIFSKDEALERTFNSDIDYNINQFQQWLFSSKSLPIIGGTIAALLLLIAAIIHMIRKKRRNKHRFRMRY